MSMAIYEDVDKAWSLTIKGNTVAVISDGTAVLGLGDIGPEAAMPVMEGKAILFKEFAGVDAFPLCLASKDVDSIVEFVKLVAPSFGAINLEDISAPRGPRSPFRAGRHGRPECRARRATAARSRSSAAPKCPPG